MENLDLIIMSLVVLAMVVWQIVIKVQAMKDSKDDVTESEKKLIIALIESKHLEFEQAIVNMCHDDALIVEMLRAGKEEEKLIKEDRNHLYAYANSRRYEVDSFDYKGKKQLLLDTLMGVKSDKTLETIIAYYKKGN